MFKTTHIFFTLLLIFATLYLNSGCDKSGTQSTETPDSLETPDTPINILEISAEPDTVLLNEITRLSCETTHNDELIFTWSSSVGTFPNGNSGDNVSWRASGVTGSRIIYVEISNGSVTVTDSVIIFVKFLPPYSHPENGSAIPDSSVTLSWETVDDSSGLILFDILFGDSFPLTLQSSNQTENSYLIENLEVYKQYSWQVIAYDEHGNTFPGPIWKFTTFTVREIQYEIGNTGVMIEMVWLPPGDFMMGAPGTYGAGDDESPSHLVNLSDGFWMGKFEVTQVQWEAVMGERIFSFEGDNKPADGISWHYAKEFIQQLNNLEQDDKWRLPTEAEWEYAARGGVYSTRFWWGDDNPYREILNHAWVDVISNGTTHDVGTTIGGIPNPYGLWDMGGNLWEWCEDWYHWGYNGAPSDGSAWIEPAGTQRIFRGGAWSFDSRRCLPTLRSMYSPSGSFSTFGFRLVRDE